MIFSNKENISVLILTNLLYKLSGGNSFVSASVYYCISINPAVSDAQLYCITKRLLHKIIHI